MTSGRVVLQHQLPGWLSLARKEQAFHKRICLAEHEEAHRRISEVQVGSHVDTNGAFLGLLSEVSFILLPSDRTP